MKKLVRGVFGLAALVGLVIGTAGATLATELTTDLNTGVGGSQRNYDFGNVVGGDEYFVDVTVSANGNSARSATFAKDAAPTFVTSVSGGTVAGSSSTTSRITITAPCVVGLFGANSANNDTQAPAGVVTYQVTSETFSDSVGVNGAFVNLKGNVTSVNSSCTPPDPCAGRTAPVAPSVSVSPTSPNGLNSWYKAGNDPSFTVTPSANAEYSIDGGTTWNPYTASVALPDGVHSVRARNFLAASTSPACPRIDGAASAAQSVKVDRVAPSVSLQGALLGSTSYFEGELPAAPTCTTDVDVTSGVNGSCSVSDYGSTVGSHTVTASATDFAGNVGTTSFTYEVRDDSSPPDIQADLDPDDPDGDNGWYTVDVSLDWTVFEGQTPSSLTIPDGECVDQVITEDQGEVSYTCSATSLGGPAGPVTSSIKRDATVPTVSLNADGPVDGGVYWEGEVDAPTCQAADDGTHASGLNGLCSVHDFSDEPGQHTVYATAIDNAGNVGQSESITYTVKDDLTPPVITKVVTPGAPNGDNGWYTVDVTVRWTVTDGETPRSLVTTGCDDQDIVDDQAGDTYSCDASSLGGDADEDSVTIKRDGTVPTISGAVDPTAPSASGWYTAQPTVTFTCGDVLSGVHSCVADGESGPSKVVGEGADQSVGGTATDEAGNTATATVSDLDVDTQKPSIDITSDTTTTASAITVSGTYSDATSGVTGVTVNGGAASTSGGGASGTFQRTSVPLECGPNAVTAVATDAAGHTESDDASIYRRCFTGAFQQPLDGGGVLNKAKLGRVVPVKLTISANSGAVPTPVYFGFRKIGCTAGAATDEVETYLAAGSSNAGNVFRLSDGVWIYNLDTSKLPGAAVNQCYQLDVYAGGTVDSAGIASGGVAVQNGIVKLHLTK